MMKMIYTNENSFLANNMKNLIATQNIKVFLKNEFSQGAVGEISAFDSWPEVWVVNEEDYNQAIAIVNSSHNSEDTVDWICTNCSETNDYSFEICWSCQHDNAER
jgi:hypothetical protein